MVKQRESSEVVKDRILKVAIELFAKFGVDGVGIRKVAAEAGINHALIIRYFGSKDGLVTEILHQRISNLTSTYPANEQSPVKAMAGLRQMLLNSMTDKDTMRLIIRSQLDGLSPESYVDKNSVKPATMIANWIQSQQKDEKLPDGRLVSAVIVGALFSFVSISPWLMTIVGLQPEDFEKRKEDVMDIIMWIIAGAIGLPPEKNAP